MIKTRDIQNSSIMSKMALFLIMVFCCVSMSDARDLKEFVVWGKRPMKEIGEQKTIFDSLALKENIALSMADVLTFNSSVFVKSYGRATLSTVSFRGTSPSHTQVTWNGMSVNNPMLGMTDLSTIPSFFVDKASLLHGASSVNETGGGLGGLVRLSSEPVVNDGFGLQYVQGVGSFNTFDEFLRVSYGKDVWRFSTRVAYSSSPNDYKYINHDKKINIYDDDKNIIGQYYPEERNRSGAFRDFHLLQDVAYDNSRGDHVGLNVWYVNSDRELPMLTTDYGDERDFENRQREQTLRAVASWRYSTENWLTQLRGGYTHTTLNYDYRREVTEGNWTDMTRSRSRVNTFFARGDAERSVGSQWYFNGSFSLHQHFVRSEDKNVITNDGNRAIIGYDKGRIELSASASAKWQPHKRIGMSFVLRQEMFGNRFAQPIPAFFVDALLSQRGNLMLRASVSRNYKFPTLNDLYFLPGGNPKLKSEHGTSYDVGMSFNLPIDWHMPFLLSGSATWFDSHIDDWIIWLPTAKGFFSPDNVKTVHAYGIESKTSAALNISSDWLLDVGASYSWTPSINKGERMSPVDQSVGKQLPYVPRHSASMTWRLSWRTWSLLYKWAYYSERYTMSSNDLTITGRLPKYYMSNVSLEKSLSLRLIDLQLKLAVNNLFNEDYLSVLSRPMPGINFELFISLTPKF